MSRFCGIAVALLLSLACAWSSAAAAAQNCTVPVANAANPGCGDANRGKILYGQTPTSAVSYTWACNQCHSASPLTDTLNSPAPAPSLLRGAPRDPIYIQSLMQLQPNAFAIINAMEACCVDDRPPNNVMGDLGDLAEFLYTCKIGAAPCVSGGGTAPPPPPPPASNYEGLWWNPGESGWGINMEHQGNTLFATWFTYDGTGKAWWLVLLANGGGNEFSGAFYQTTGSPYDAATFNAGNSSFVGPGKITFKDANTGTLDYTINGVTDSKPITREVFGALPVCASNDQPNWTQAKNYQGLWWNASEQGWGINFAHEGDTIFATWFTFDHDGSPLWLVGTMPRGEGQSFAGTLFRMSATPFGASPFVANTPAEFGSATLTFADGNNATFTYTAGTTPRTKQLTRELFYPPAATVCH
jgi:hypothetical protein